MNFGQAIVSCFRNYATFSGRAPRSEYWYFLLFRTIALAVASILDKSVLKDHPYTFNVAGQPHQTGMLGLILGVGFFLPALAVGYRRLHDTNRSAWSVVGLILLVIIILAGIGYVQGMNYLKTIAIPAALAPYIIVLYWLRSKGTPGYNRFGDDPLRFRPRY